ncbi:hypothetical protein B0H10DRAFT_1976115 [Mycena sp. CBHHK59/15]|nr:hypothetical protein B0H10DRAFT_1976115 [Mycena sp. CBHHK59/15]
MRLGQVAWRTPVRKQENGGGIHQPPVWHHWSHRPDTCEYFMFAVDGQYYECADFDVYRFDMPFASHDDFVHSIQPKEVRRAMSTKLEPLPESDEENDMESGSDEDFALDGDEVGTGSPLCKL